MSVKGELQKERLGVGFFLITSKIGVLMREREREKVQGRGSNDDEATIFISLSGKKS